MRTSSKSPKVMTLFPAFFIPIFVIGFSPQATSHYTPDLEVSEFSAPFEGQPGQQIYFSFLVWNRGSSFTGEYGGALYIASTEAWQYGIKISSGFFRNLAPGANEFVQGDAQIPDLETGSYYLIIVIDPDEQIQDSDRSNNIAVQYFEVQ